MSAVAGLVERLRTKRWLNGCVRVGRDARLDGKPTIGAAGHIGVGRAVLDVLGPAH